MRPVFATLLTLHTLALTPGCDEPTAPGTPGPDASSAVASVVSTVPMADSVGVAADRTLVLRFDRPMDPTRVEAALSSPDFDPAAATRVWNAAGDELSITPASPLPIAEGTADVGLEPEAIELHVAATAAGLDGATLAEAFVLRFFTVRRITSEVLPMGTLSGTARDDESVDDRAHVVGDDASNRRLVDALTFDVPALPRGGVVESATVESVRSNVTGSPTSTLGDLALEEVVFDALSDAAILRHASAVDVRFSTDPQTAETRAVSDVTDVAVVTEDRTPAGDPFRIQLRYRFATATDTDGANDAYVFRIGSHRLRLVVLAP